MNSSSQVFNDSLVFQYVDYTQISEVRYTIIIVWVILDLITLFGNLFVVLVFSTNRTLYSITNYYILNLAVTDFLVAIIVMPLKLLELASEFRMFVKPALCPVIQFILMTLVFTSLLTLVVISIERYFVIVYPFNSRIFKSRTKTKMLIALTWIVSALVSTGMLHSTTDYSYAISHFGAIKRFYCRDMFTPQQRISYIMSVMSLFYVLPLGIITFTTIRIIIVLLRPIPELSENQACRGRTFRQEESKRKVAKMIVVMTIVFIVSWSPWFVSNTVALFDNFFVRGNFFFVFLILHLTGFLNSACNPIIYFIMSERIRGGIIKLLRLIFCCADRNQTAIQLRFHHCSSASINTTNTAVVHYQLGENNGVNLHLSNQGIHGNKKLAQKNRKNDALYDAEDPSVKKARSKETSVVNNVVHNV